MSTQPDMFPAAYMDSPELVYRRKQQAKYERFKKRHEIFTHHNEGIEECHWSALAFVKACYSIEGCRFETDPVRLIAEYAECLDDHELMMYGQSEIQVVHKLAERHQLHDPEKIDWSVL